MQYTIKMTKTLEPTRIQDLVIGFVESNYSPWCQKVRFFSWDEANESHEVSYSTVIEDSADFFKARWSMELLVENPSSDGPDYISVRVGWKKLKWAFEREAIRRHVSDFLDENDDANTYDCIMQTAVFKEVVYG